MESIAEYRVGGFPVFGVGDSLFWEEPGFVGTFNRPMPVRNVKLREDRRDVVIYRFGRQVKMPRYVIIRLSMCEFRQHLAFAPGEQRDIRAGRWPRTARNAPEPERPEPSCDSRRVGNGIESFECGEGLPEVGLV